MPENPLGDGFLASMIEDRLRKAVTDVFADYSADDLQKYIIADTPVVKNELPEETREKFQERADNYEPLIRQHLHPPLVWNWVSDPSWAPTEDAREELRECSEAIRSTPGGKEWFEEQVYSIWDIAGIDRPEDPESIS